MTTFNGDQPYNLTFEMGCGGVESSPVEQQFGHACEMAQTTLGTFTTYEPDTSGYNAYWANLLPRMQAIFRYAFGNLPIVNPSTTDLDLNNLVVTWNANPNIGA